MAVVDQTDAPVLTTARAAAAKRPSRLFRNLTSKIAMIPLVLVAVGIFVGFTVWTIVYSFTKSRLLPKLDFVGLDQYTRLWADRRWLQSIENLVIYGVCSLVLTLVIGFTLAALLDRKIRGEDVFRTIILYPFEIGRAHV